MRYALSDSNGLHGTTYHYATGHIVEHRWGNSKGTLYAPAPRDDDRSERNADRIIADAMAGRRARGAALGEVRIGNSGPHAGDVARLCGQARQAFTMKATITDVLATPGYFDGYDRDGTDTKTRFHAAAKAFWKRVAKDLHLSTGAFKVNTNLGGPAVQGETYLNIGAAITPTFDLPLELQAARGGGLHAWVRYDHAGRCGVIVYRFEVNHAKRCATMGRNREIQVSELRDDTRYAEWLDELQALLQLDEARGARA